MSDLLRSKVERSGPAGERWLTELAGRVRECERAWDFTAEAALPGGSEAYVVRGRRGTGEEAVLKLAPPGGRFADELRTLTAARGRGYVAVLASDPDGGAALLEALGPSLDERAAASGQREAGRARWVIEVLCATLRRAWQPPPADAVPSADRKAAELLALIEQLWQELDRPCPERVVARARTYARRRAEAWDPGRAVVVHGDPHPGNALAVRTPRSGAEPGHVFVDPDGFVGDPAYDLGVVLRDGCGELALAPDPVGTVRSPCLGAAAATGVAADAVWEWAYTERVSTGLYLLALGEEEWGRGFLHTAELLSE
ncbi:aminoglycoside phosphotransferase family protein [Streptomyces sp. XM4193]|uniref:aminoglycoside phosphotransferase family protein n=1 Tax=Streptomyces sp. XM4193 TaxID=2929782 RepID=UPI001FF97D8D|nr:phosphotransferase [Streptomyces sp. XM4193]MCK1796692.1 aminoglycoside phosphotransferase family protein [Streptomyces sp. XM4193]